MSTARWSATGLLMLPPQVAIDFVEHMLQLAGQGTAATTAWVTRQLHRGLCVTRCPACPIEHQNHIELAWCQLLAGA